MSTGSMECPICGIANPHKHEGDVGGPPVAIDSRVERIAHALAAAQQNIMAFPAEDAAAAFRRLSPRVRTEMWENAEALLIEIVRIEEAARCASE